MNRSSATSKKCTRHLFMLLLGSMVSLCCLFNVILLLNLDKANIIYNRKDNEKDNYNQKISQTETTSVPSLSKTSMTTTTTILSFGDEDYKEKLKRSMMPYTNVSTAAYRHSFWAGFCNQYMMFVGLIILAKQNNYSQLLVESIRWKDTYGTNLQIRHDVFFDVVHWNSYYPNLPRIVTHNEDLFPDVSISGSDMSPRIKWKAMPMENSSKPYFVGEKQTSAVHAYLNYDKKVSKKSMERFSFEIDIMKDAFQPHPEIQAIIRGFLNGLNGNKGSDFMVLHARIEPDMQKHSRCLDLKVVSFQHIIRMLEAEFVDPPVSTLIVILNRELLEKEVENVSNNNNTLAEENLKVLNHILAQGLWGGRVKVMEAGSKLAIESKHGIYSKYSTLSGGIINFFMALQANIFVGTEVSSYSSALVKSRFFRNKHDNYFYAPQGLKMATPLDATDPPVFAC